MHVKNYIYIVMKQNEFDVFKIIRFLIYASLFISWLVGKYNSSSEKKPESLIPSTNVHSLDVSGGVNNKGASFDVSKYMNKTGRQHSEGFVNMNNVQKVAPLNPNRVNTKPIKPYESTPLKLPTSSTSPVTRALKNNGLPETPNYFEINK